MATPNLVIPSGRLYYQLEDADGNLTGGEHYLAETPGFTITGTPTQVEAFQADTAVEEQILDVTTRMVRTAAITTRDIQDAVLAMFSLGSSATVTQTAVAVVGEALGALEKGAYYQLGVTTARPTGIRGCSAVTVKGAGTAITLNTDYTLDQALGRVYIKPETALTAGIALTADYTPAANTRTQVAGDAIQSVSVALRLIADNTAGANRDIYIPRATLIPNGDWTLKSRSEVQQLGFTAKIKRRTLADGTMLAAVYVDGRPS